MMGVTMKRFLSIIASLALLVSLASDGLAQRDDRAVRVQGREAADPRQRVALVIGNAQYKNISALRNPQNDARDMAAALRASGFQVTLLLNGTRKRMNLAIRAFGNKLRRGGVGLFFYAGHGVQLDGVNYLIPIGADIRNEDEVEDEAVSANRVMRKMKSAGNDLNMVFLDACRNNPYKGSFRSASRGLAAAMNAPKGSLISYATGAGNVAADGSGRNGTYTKNLLRYMKVPGLELGQMMRRVRASVQRDTNGEQTPYELSSLTGNFYFRGGPAAPVRTIAKTRPAPGPVRTIDAEEEFWKAVQNSKNPAHFRAYLQKYPRGRFAEIANIKIDLLTPAVKPPAPKRPQQAAIRRRPPNYDRLRNLGTGRPLRTFSGHTSYVLSVAFSADGRLALSGSADKTLRLWEAPTGQLLRTFSGHTASVWSVAFSADGRLALSGSDDKTLKLWEAGTGRLLRTFSGHTSYVRSVAFSPDGRLALSGSRDKTLKLWEAGTGRLLRTFSGHTSFVSSVAFSPDGRLALSGSVDKTLKLWEAGTGRLLRTFSGHTSIVISVAFSPDGRLALSGSVDKTLKLWDLGLGR